MWAEGEFTLTGECNEKGHVFAAGQRAVVAPTGQSGRPANQYPARWRDNEAREQRFTRQLRRWNEPPGSTDHGLELHGGPGPNIDSFSVGIYGSEAAEYCRARWGECRLQHSDSAEGQFVIAIKEKYKLTTARG